MRSGEAICAELKETVSSRVTTMRVASLAFQVLTSRTCGGPSPFPPGGDSSFLDPGGGGSAPHPPPRPQPLPPQPRLPASVLLSRGCRRFLLARRVPRQTCPT